MRAFVVQMVHNLLNCEIFLILSLSYVPFTLSCSYPFSFQRCDLNTEDHNILYILYIDGIHRYYKWVTCTDITNG